MKPLEKGKNLTTGQVAALAGVSDSTARKWCKSKMLKAHTMPGSRVRYVRPQDLVDFLRTYDNPVPDELKALL